MFSCLGLSSVFRLFSGLFLILCFLSGSKPRNRDLPIDVGEYSCERNSQEHTWNAPYLSSDNEEDEDKECRHLKCRAEESGLDDITVDKLQSKREDQERNHKFRLCEQEDDSTDECADKGTECGSEICKY